MDWQGWLELVEKIERAYPEKRVTAVRIPGGLPKIAWNVQSSLMRGMVPVSSECVENMRMGIFGNFVVTDGPFLVRFNTGEIAE